MKNYKRIIALLLVLMLVLVFAGCGSNGSDSDQADDQTQDEQSQDVDTEDSDESDTDADTDVDTDEEIFDEEDLEDLDDMDEEDADVDEKAEDEEEADNDNGVPSLPSELTGDYTGGFASDTETALNLNVQWAANEGSDDLYDVKFQFFLDCYSLTVSERNYNKLQVKTSSGTKEYTFKTKEVNREDTTRDTLFIGETTIQLSADELAEGAKVKAIWDFRGSYSGTELPEVVAEGQVKS